MLKIYKIETSHLAGFFHSQNRLKRVIFIPQTFEKELSTVKAIFFSKASEMRS